jgi:uncharacterized protein YccT (UPF0319 family)
VDVQLQKIRRRKRKFVAIKRKINLISFSLHEKKIQLWQKKMNKDTRHKMLKKKCFKTMQEKEKGKK